MSSEKPPKDPLPVHYLRDRAESWGVSGDSVVIMPKRASFDELHVRKIYIEWGFGESKWQFTGFVSVTPKEEMDEKSVELYRMLKNLETDLRWKGFISRKPIFQVSSSLQDLALHIKSLRPSEELAETLNSDDQVLRLVRRVKPDLLRIRLESVQLEGIELLRADEMLPLHLVRGYYEKPRRVMWLIAVTRVNLPTPWIGNLMKNSYSLVDHLAELVRKKTDEVRASIGNSQNCRGM